jgi:hypothetical protein
MAARDLAAVATPLFCPDCGQKLPAPGGMCPSCPQFDAERRAIMADYRHQLDRLRAVDVAENAQLLRESATRARRAVRPVQEATAPLRKAVRDAIDAERAAADRCRVAEDYLRKVTRAEQKARRGQAGPAARTEALLRVRAAADVARGDKAAAEGAKAAREAADLVLSGHLGQLARLEDEAVTAEWAAGHPPAVVPPSVWTALLAHPLQVLTARDLGAEARVLAGAQVANLARLSGVADELRAEGHAAGLREHENRFRDSPAWLAPAGDGRLAIVPNPHHPATPQQFHPPAQSS